MTDIVFDVEYDEIHSTYYAIDKTNGEKIELNKSEGLECNKYPSIVKYLKNRYNIHFNFNQLPEIPKLEGESFPDGTVFSTGGRRKIYRLEEHTITINDIGRIIAKI